ncbi:MAG: hypothetical protein GWP91_07975 [Rhodobacterales bacterium]|nr:hypothetical protein [Rhodobacterales bacterium]
MPVPASSQRLAMIRRTSGLFATGALLSLGACEFPPNFVKDDSQIDTFLVQKAYASACVGLKMDKDDDLRRYTAERLAAYGHVKIANECLCEALYNAEAHTSDAVVAQGLAGLGRNDLAACLIPALADSAITGEDRTWIVRGLAGMDADAAYGKLEDLVLNDSDAVSRAYAAEALRPAGGAQDTLIKVLQEDVDANVRAAAARGLTGRKGDKVAEALMTAAQEDADGGVRADALTGAVRKTNAVTDAMVCSAMLEDEDERVRNSAVKTYHGSKRKRAIDCLAKRLITFEESGTVRQSTLDALGASPSEHAALALCDSMGPFLRLHLKDDLQHKTPGTDIFKAQNDRDWERSYDCVGKAISAGGLSCYARNYLGHKFRELGGSAAAPLCPGMQR